MYPNTAKQNLCGLMQWMVPVVYPCEEEVEAFRWGLKRDMSPAADLADSKEEASNKEEVWKKGSARRFLF